MTVIHLSDGGGVIHRYENYPSKFVEPRHVDVWCPRECSGPGTMHFPVIYMQDGQNLFDPSIAYGGVDWGIDEAITRLMNYHQIVGVFVVGVWNSARRWREYMPEKPLNLPEASSLREKFSAENDGPPMSNQYLRFLVEELKPFIDTSYRTLSDREHTFVMGSSMGALLSLYALTEYPRLFGGAACLSTHWPSGGSILVDYLGKHLPKPGKHKLYFDYGTETLDAEYETYQQRMDVILRARGYTRGEDWITEKFAGAEHSETAWRTRVHVPLLFLLGEK